MSSTIDLFKHSNNYEMFLAGQTIFKEGQYGDMMYVVKEGEVDVLSNGKVLEHLVAGQIFGEMGLVDKGQRSATVIARTNCKIVPIDSTKFNFLVQNAPFFALQVLQIMSERVRRMNQSKAGSN